MTTPVCLHSLTTAVPKHVIGQSDVMAEAQTVFGRRGADIERLLPVYENAGITRRYSCVPLAWYGTPSGWKDRNALYVDHAVALLKQAAERALERARLTPADVDSIVTVSTSGVATPSLDARLMNEMPFRPDVHRLPIFGLGCAGGVLGLGRAAALARAMPGSVVLLLVVELCGLTFRNRDTSKSNVIATALFGDGAAAAVLSCGQAPACAQLTGWGEHTWPDSLDVMGWRVEEDGLGVLFSRDIPMIVREGYGAALDAFLARQGLGRGDLAGVLCHPGGAKVVDAIEDVLAQPRGSLADARSILRDFGNMSAATVLFVVERALNRGLRGRHLVSALGPGFTAGFALLDVP